MVAASGDDRKIAVFTAFAGMDATGWSKNQIGMLVPEDIAGQARGL